ncbi:MAG: hypothetical protein NWF07_14615, partial [Candidatus Bathyarchaeota archaeon]|nr:hypothetical protein [Candidatus Bathyarchaeota archaeon]
MVIRYWARPEQGVKRFEFGRNKAIPDAGELVKKATRSKVKMSENANNIIVPTESSGAAIVVSTGDSSQNPTTHFADDTLGYQAKLYAEKQEDPFSDLIIAPSSQTIVDFLQRPSIISSGVFTASDSGILYIDDITSLITPPKQSRMNNIYTWRADFDLTLQVNADRFQQGRYILFYLPTGGVSPPAIGGNVLAWRNMHTCHLTKITQLPHVEIDLATQTHVSLHIPYISANPMNTWSSTTATAGAGLGLFGIVPYSKLDPGTGGSTTCGYTLLGSLSNVQIGAASVGQAGDASTAEAKAKGVGPLTQTLNKVSKSIGIFGEVPIIGSYARTVSWFTKLMSNSAEIWGWSKPTALSAPIRNDRKIHVYSAVSDGSHYGKPLGVMSENSVGVPSSIPVSVDEMDLAFVANHYAYISSYSWTGAQSAGTTLADISVTPQGSYTWSKGQVHTPLSFVSNQFARWRGGIRYRFKLVKTAFHRGRLAVAFYPGLSGGAGNLAYSELVFREIVDVNLTSEFEVCCPYMVAPPWLYGQAPIGVLHVYVVDPLVAPATVSNSVNVLVEVAAAEDIQFACPVNWQVEPYCPSTAQSGESYTEVSCFELGPKIRKPNYRLAAETTGEVVKSVRQLIKRNWNLSGP